MLKQETVSVAPEERESSLVSLGLVVIVLLGVGAFLIVTTVPFEKLLGDSSWAMIAAFHGLAAALLMVTATVGLYLAYRLFTGQIKAFNDLELMAVVVSTLSFLTIAFGNWIYIGYRASGGVREYFLANAPELHAIFFEFKEFIALFTLPLAIAATFILLRYGPDILKRPWLKATVAILLALVFFYFAIAFGLGAAITKIKPV